MKKSISSESVTDRQADKIIIEESGDAHWFEKLRYLSWIGAEKIMFPYRQTDDGMDIRTFKFQEGHGYIKCYKITFFYV